MFRPSIIIPSQLLISAACLANTSCVMVAIMTAQNETNSGESDTPNIGKDLSDADKAELGGTGPGTPGGWGQEDKARNSESSVNPENRAEYEKYVDSLRASMEKPNVQDENLSNIIDDLYRPNAKVGSGSTADAVRCNNEPEYTSLALINEPEANGIAFRT